MSEKGPKTLIKSYGLSSHRTIGNGPLTSLKSYSKVLPLRNSLHKGSLIGFLCQDTVCLFKQGVYTML